MTTLSLSRSQIIDRILTVFRQHGYEGASLSRLSEATGLGRSSLYHHFPKGKEDMASAALKGAEHLFVEQIVNILYTDSPAIERVHLFTENLARFYQEGFKTCLIDVLSIGETAPVFQPFLRQRIEMIQNGLQQVLTELGLPLDEARQRAENTMVGIQGSLVVSRVMGENGAFMRMIEQLPGNLLQGIATPVAPTLQ